MTDEPKAGGSGGNVRFFGGLGGAGYNGGPVGEPGEIQFLSPDGETMFLAIRGNGDFVVNGRVVENDRAVFDAFLRFLCSAGVWPATEPADAVAADRADE